MAWLETKSGVFRIRFRFADGKQFLSLQTRDQKEADALGRFESHLPLIEQGLLELPEAGADLGTYILSDGKFGGRPSHPRRSGSN